MGNEVYVEGLAIPGAPSVDVMTSMDDFSVLLRSVVAKHNRLKSVSDLTSKTMRDFLSVVDDEYGPEDDYGTYSLEDI